jgi:trehalose 6-phosphate phosphatase
MEISAVSSLDNALKKFDLFEQVFLSKSPVFFLDFDGTLTPIVNDPKQAQLSLKTKNTLIQLSQRYPVYIVSGRGLEDISSRIGIDEITCVGCHGFELPQNLMPERLEPEKFIADLDQAEEEIFIALNDFRGIFIERKKYALAVHYRNCPLQDIPLVEQIVQNVMTHSPNLKANPGKKVFDIKPAVDWNKGRAVGYLFNSRFSIKNEFPIYIGDDVTDEDAFEEVGKMSGAGIIVNENPTGTKAEFMLKSTDEVAAFLNRITDHFGKTKL